MNKYTKETAKSQKLFKLSSVQDKPVELQYSAEKDSRDGGLLLLK